MAWPLLLAWFVAPEVTRRLDRPLAPAAQSLSDEQRAFLRRLARRTWSFFETFVGPDDHWLPPDNYQEEPHSAIVHRTPTTNIGILLLSSVSAWQLGDIGLTTFATRLRTHLEASSRLAR